MKQLYTLFFLLVCISLQAQVNPNTYVFSTNTSATLYNMVNADTLISGGQDNIRDDVKRLPFIFGFLGALHNSFCVSTNGVVYLTPQSSNNSYYRIAALGAEGNNNNYKWSGSGMGTSRNGAIRCKTFGTEPFRTFVVSFDKMSLSAKSGNEDATFQVALFESSGVIQFIYGMMNVSDTVQGVTDPMIANTASNQYLLVNTNTNTSSYSTSLPWSYTRFPGFITSLHSPTNGSCRTYTFTPPSIPNYVNTTLTFSGTTSGVTALNIPDYDPNYIYYCKAATAPAGPFTTGTILTSNVMQGKPDSVYYYQLYRSNGAAVSTNYASGSITYGSPRKFISQANGFWADNTTWGKPSGIYPLWGDTVIVSANDTVKLDNFLAASAMDVTVIGVIDYANAFNPMTVGNMQIAAGGLVKVHNGSTVSNPNATAGRTLVVAGNLTGAGKIDMRYNNCRLHIRSIETGSPHIIDINFEHGNNNTPLLNSLTVSAYNSIQLLKPLTINKEIIGEYGTVITNNNLTIDRLASVGTQTTPSAFTLYRYSRSTLFSGTVNYAPGTLPQLYYMGFPRFFDLAASFATSPFIAGTEVPSSDSVYRLQVYTNAGVNISRPITVSNQVEWDNGHVNMVNGDDFVFCGSSYYYTSGGIRTNGWVKLLQYQTSAVGLMNTPGNSNVYPILSNNAKRFSFLQGALSADGLYGVRHIDASGTTAFASSFTENGNTFSKRSNAYWEVSSPTGMEFTNNAFHFRASGIDSLNNHQLTNVCFGNGAASGTHLTTIGNAASPIIARTALNSTNIATNKFYVGFAVGNPLSTDLISFNGFKKEQGNLLEWEVTPSTEMKTINLEKSIDGKSYSQLASFLTNKEQKKYSYLDLTSLEGNQFYRLKMMDATSTISYSNTVLLTRSHNNNNVTLFPNPATESLFITTEKGTANGYFIYDLHGKTMLTGNLHFSSPTHVIDIRLLPEGMYMLALVDARGEKIAFIKFIKN